MKRILMIALSLSVVLIWSCRTTHDDASILLEEETAGLQPLAKQTGANAMCGVKHYNSQRHSSCGVESYINKRSSRCGVEKYKKKSSLECSGSSPRESYTERKTACITPPRLSCRSGFRKDSQTERDVGRCLGHGPDSESKYETKIVCVKDAVLKKCRLPEHGVESYKSCRHSAHGVEKYKSCRKPAFGVESYNTCSWYLLPSQVTTYLHNKSSMIQRMGEILVDQKAAYFSDVQEEPAFACHITKYNGDPLMSRQIEELKVIYESTFGQAWSAGRFDCSEDVTSNIDQESCPADDQSRLCRSVRSYRSAKRWLEVVETDLTHLSTDIPANRDPNLKSRILEQLNIANKY